MHPDQQTPNEHRSSNAEDAPAPAGEAPDANPSGEPARIPEREGAPSKGDAGERNGTGVE